jgi:hypothetical protein
MLELTVGRDPDCQVLDPDLIIEYFRARQVAFLQTEDLAQSIAPMHNGIAFVEIHRVSLFLKREHQLSPAGEND